MSRSSCGSRSSSGSRGRRMSRRVGVVVVGVTIILHGPK